MLARENRVTAGDDYRRISRRGKRVNAVGLTIYGETNRDLSAPTRFGFIVTKRVGVAVVRNRVRRRLKSICRELLPLVPTGASLVFRVHPEALEYSYDRLRSVVREAVLRLATKLELESSGSAAEEFCSCADEV